jgi:hypothetical protein
MQSSAPLEAATAKNSFMREARSVRVADAPPFERQDLQAVVLCVAANRANGARIRMKFARTHTHTPHLFSASSGRRPQQQQQLAEVGTGNDDSRSLVLRSPAMLQRRLRSRDGAADRNALQTVNPRTCDVRSFRSVPLRPPPLVRRRSASGKKGQYM